MYLDFFGLKRPPFRITPDTEFFHEGGNRGAVLEALTWAILHGEGIVKVTGEVGSGKTMLCRVLQARLAGQVDAVYLSNPSVSPEEILHAIAIELQLPVARDARRLEVMHALQDYLLARHAEGRQVVVFVEESQGMPIATLEEIRLLSNLETDHDKLLQLVLFGQPELDENLRQSRIRQLRERITHSFRLTPLGEEDIRDYLAFRLHTAGYRGPELFTPKVVGLIARASGGLTRRVNLIADKALLAAFAANTRTITTSHVTVAVRDSEFSRGDAEPATAGRAVPWGPLAAGLASVAVVLAGWMLLQRGIDPPAPVPAGIRLPAGPPTPAPEAAKPDSPAGPAAGSSQLPADPGGNAPGAPAPAAAASEPQAAAANTAAAIPEKPSLPQAAASVADKAALPPDFLERRLLATEAWLATSPEGTYTIQLVGSADRNYLRDYFNLVAKYFDKESIFVYGSSRNADAALTVVVGTYGSAQAVREAIAALPTDLSRYGPYLRTVRGIRTEIQAARSGAPPG